MACGRRRRRPALTAETAAAAGSRGGCAALLADLARGARSRGWQPRGPEPGRQPISSAGAAQSECSPTHAVTEQQAAQLSAPGSWLLLAPAHEGTWPKWKLVPSQLLHAAQKEQQLSTG